MEVSSWFGRHEVSYGYSSIEENQIKLRVDYMIDQDEWHSGYPHSTDLIIDENNSFIAGYNSLKVLEKEGIKVLFTIYCYETVCFNFDYYFLDKSGLKMVDETSC